MKKKMVGSCLCGAVRYELDQTPTMVGDCYCIDCRKSSGTSHCTHAASPEAALRLSGEVTFYDHAADSGNVVRRGFCATCGSPLYSTNSGMPGVVFVRVSSLDEPSGVTPQMTVYAKRAPSWARIDRDRPVFEGMPTEAAAAAEG